MKSTAPRLNTPAEIETIMREANQGAVRIAHNLRALYAMAHVIGPDGKVWDFRFEDYPASDKPNNIVYWNLALVEAWLYGKLPDGKIARFSYHHNGEYVDSIPSGATVLPDYWTQYLKTEDTAPKVRVEG